MSPAPPPYALRATACGGRTVHDLPDPSAAPDQLLTPRTGNGDTKVHPG
ncbi:hypothetical protein ABZV64_07210 [Streptomyces sp. NPDC004959]